MSDNQKKQLPVHSPGQPRPLKQARLWPLWVLCLIVLVAVAGLAWQQWQMHQQQQQQQQSHSQAQERLERIENTSDELRQDLRGALQTREERLNRLESRLDEKSDQQERMHRQIEHNARSLLGMGQRTRTDWLLAEAEYLMRLANQRLFFEGDFRGALAMLESADEVLAETDDVGSYPVRQALAREILSLKAIEPVDQAGLYLKLDAAIQQLESLTDQALTGHDDGLSGQPEPSGADSVDNAWSQIRDTLRDIVVIRRMDTPVQALPSPLQSTQARLHLRLMLEEAGIAVLRRDQAVYERSLSRAEEWLQQWYQQDSPRVTALQQTLEELSGRNIDPPLPAIDESLTLLKQRIAGRLQQREETPEEAAAEEPPEETPQEADEDPADNNGESGS